jgi:colanic acid biosynthesis glycosyl transferase WcaI
VNILFLNQYFPPDPAPTGILLRELGDHMEARGHQVRYLSANQNYRSGKQPRSRMAREAAALLSIFWQGLLAPRADLIFSASSPPCLLMAAAILAKWHRAKSAHWAMDLYPELAEVLGEIPPRISRCIAAAMGLAYRNTNLLVGLDEDMAEKLSRYGVRAKSIAPWVFQGLSKTSFSEAPAEEWIWMYSGNLGRAHEWKTLLDAQAILEKRQLPCHLLFQGGGPSWPAAKAYAEQAGVRNCSWKPYVEADELRSSLLKARLLAVTQKPETQGLLWPSKLALISTLPRPMLWVGPLNGAIAKELRQWNCAGIFALGQASEIADWIAMLHNQGHDGFEPSANADETRETRLQTWSALLEGV